MSCQLVKGSLTYGKQNSSLSKVYLVLLLFSGCRKLTTNKNDSPEPYVKSTGFLFGKNPEKETLVFDGGNMFESLKLYFIEGAHVPALL